MVERVRGRGDEGRKRRGEESDRERRRRER